MKLKNYKKFLFLLVSIFLLVGCGDIENFDTNFETSNNEDSFLLSDFENEELFSWDNENGYAYKEVNNNIPYFEEEEITTEEFEIYEELDSLGRCGVAYANICQNLMPNEERGKIGMIKPSGWVQNKYAGLVDGNYLYNRCHLIGFQLAGENANERNLITGTRYLNIEGMLDFENEVANYVRETNNHVLYRVTPVFEGDNLLASGVQMEALSVEDNGEGICFNIYAYNKQPGIEIDYRTGENWLKEEYENEENEVEEDSIYKENENGTIYILNTNTKKYHYEDCPNAQKIKEENKEIYNGTTNWLKDNRYTPCGKCKPE